LKELFLYLCFFIGNRRKSIQENFGKTPEKTTGDALKGTFKGILEET
jgi:hypothetical protein